MYKEAKMTKVIRFRVTPEEKQMIDEAVALQTRKILRDRSKLCRVLLTRFAKNALAQEAATDAGAKSGESAGKKAASK